MIDEILVRYFEGEASEDEIKTLNVWRQKSSDNELEFQDFKGIWNATSDLNELEHLDIEGDLQLVKSQVTKLETPIRKINFLRRIAAIMLPLFVFGLGIYFYTLDSNAQVIYTLSDGTKVWLNGDSTLDFPEKFDNDIRKVTLTGEAFFDVAKNPDKPFIIESGLTNVEVLGTSFNIKMIAHETSVIVATGKVKFYEKGIPEKMVILTPGEKGVYQSEGITKLENKNKNYASWHTGVFEFDGTPIKEVIQELSLFYGVIKLNEKIDPACLFDGILKQDSKKSIIETLELSCGVK